MVYINGRVQVHLDLRFCANETIQAVCLYEVCVADKPRRRAL